MRLDEWPDKRKTCPHLKVAPPRADAALSHIISVDGFLPLEYFDFDVPHHLAWSWTRCAQWIHPSSWNHSSSHTLKGGPYGVKWAVLLLVHIRINTVSLINGAVPTYADPRSRVQFTQCDEVFCAGQWRSWPKRFKIQLRSCRVRCPKGNSMSTVSFSTNQRIPSSLSATWKPGVHPGLQMLGRYVTLGMHR